MSTYYAYQDVKVKIAHRLMKMDGWKVYGYHADQSDSMTDYYDPAYWDGIAEKNGYRLVIDKQTAKEDKTETRTRYNNGNLSFSDIEKIKKLEAMTTERGASAQEAETAQRKIEAIRAHVEEGREEYTVFTPGHLANPPRCNWHIEKDGVIYDKGTGLLKFASVPDISGLGYSYERDEWQKFNTMTEKAWKADYIREYERKWSAYTDEAYAKKCADSAYDSASEKYALLEKFNLLISRFNSICGGMVGNEGETYTYEEVTETQYKTELKPRETATGSITEGQCFIVKTGFNYGHEKGYVYRIHEHYTRTDGTKAYIAYRLGKGYKKERTGTAGRGNSWSIYDPEKFLRWFAQSALAWCELEEVKTPYEVKKVVKRTVKAEAEKEPENATTAATETAAENDLYTITADTDTRDNSRIFVVKLNVSLSKDEFAKERAKMKKCGGYYSRYKHGFIFKDDPTAALFADTENAENLPEDNTPAEDTTERTETDAERTEPISAEESTPEAETATEPEKPPHICGYHEESRNIFTPEEIADLLSGKRITQDSGEKYGKSRFHYIAQKYNNSIFLVYIMKEYGSADGNPEQITPGASFDYFGFIHRCRFYATGENKEILRKFSEDIAHKVAELIPDEATAEQNAAHIATYDRENIEQYYINGDFTKAAQEHFYTGEEPEISIHPDMSRTGNADIIRYIMEPEIVTAERAEEFIKANAANIYKQYIQRNKTAEILRRIKADRSRPEHRIKQICDSITDEKTVKITLENGQTIRAEASAVKRITSFGYIHSYDVIAADRDKLPRNEYNRVADVTPDMIRSIEHGKRILYKAA